MLFSTILMTIYYCSNIILVFSSTTLMPIILLYIGFLQYYSDAYIILLYIGFLQYYSDANEVESWLKEKEPLVSSHNYGRDVASAKVRLQYTYM